MPVQEFEFRPGRFPAVRYDGTNLAEIAEFIGGSATLKSVSGILGLELPEGDDLTERTLIVGRGWWVRRTIDGTIAVTSTDAEWASTSTPV